MFIAHIAIQNFGAVPFYEASFTPELNLLDSCYADELSAALSFLLCSNAPYQIPQQWLQKDTRISAKVNMGNRVYTLLAAPWQGRLRLFATDLSGEDATAFYRHTLSHSPEQDAVEAFDGRDETIPLCLFRYRYGEDGDGRPHKTHRFSDTKTFRQHLLQYIKTFSPEPINSKKPYQAIIAPSGRFAVFYPGVPGEVYLSETEKKLFLYVCFLNITEFWGKFEKIRDLHHESKPLLIRNFLEYLDASVDIEPLLARTLQFHRQVIILTTPIDRETKRKWIGGLK